MNRNLRIPVILILGLGFFAGMAAPAHEGPPSENRRTLKPIDIDKITVGRIHKIGYLKLFERTSLYPVALCWSPDDSRLFVMAILSSWPPPSGNPGESISGFCPSPCNPCTPPEEREHLKSELSTLSAPGCRHCASYSSIAVTGKDHRWEEGLPDWALPYWKFKAGKVSPEGVELQTGPGTTDEGLTLKGQEVETCYPGHLYSWSPPGGRAIVFRQGKDIYLMSADGKQKRKIAKGSYILPAWSNDGKKIAFIRDNRDHLFMGDYRSPEYKYYDFWEVYAIDLSGIEHEGGR
jgi:hypothetical protein